MEKYSVLMAVYFKEKAEYLRMAIDSMLCQTAPPEEFVLVCDGPLTEALEAVIAEYCSAEPGRFRVVRLERNMGLGAALNAGLQQCRNELVARMDSDDIALPDRMEKQLAEMQIHPNAAVLGGQIAEFFEDRKTITAYREVPTDSQKIRNIMKYRNPMNHVTVVMRRSCVLAAGKYPQFTAPGFEDYFLWVTLLARGCELRNILDVCCRVRVSDGQYCRRGGWKYFQNAMKVQRLLLGKEIISFPQFCINSAVWFCEAMVVPAGFRKKIFLRFLRSPELPSAEREVPVPLRAHALGGEKWL